MKSIEEFGVLKQREDEENDVVSNHIRKLKKLIVKIRSGDSHELNTLLDSIHSESEKVASIFAGLKDNINLIKDERGREFISKLISDVEKFVDLEHKLVAELKSSTEKDITAADEKVGYLLKSRNILKTALDEFSKRYGVITQINVIGYGEISVVFSVERQGFLRKQEFVFKKLPYFSSIEEVKDYIKLYDMYHLILHKIGVDTPDWYAIYSKMKDGYCVYALQEKLPKPSLGNVILHDVGKVKFMKMFEHVVEKISRVDDFNSGKMKIELDEWKGSEIKIGFDAQISNWAFMPDGRLLYLDTSTPLIRKNGEEQLNVELFLKAVPIMFTLIIKLFILDKVLDRYYDMRGVVLDLIANFIKEKKPEYIPDLLRIANEFLMSKNITPIEEKEVFKYYREDAMIWRFFQFARRVERFVVEKIFRREYKLKLPEKIER